MRQIFTTQDALREGISKSALRWGVRKGNFQRVGQGVYIAGNEPPTDFERAAALVVGLGGVASGSLAGILHNLDSVPLAMPFVTMPLTSSGMRPEVRRCELPPEVITFVQGIACTNGLRTILDLAATLSDLKWEQAFESALHKRLTSVGEITSALPSLGASRTSGVTRIRRMLSLRPEGAPPTESLLETLTVQLIRRHTNLPPPQRQVEVRNRHGQFVARVDLAWPSAGLFLELDGQHHLDQPVHDARRETAVVAATGWRPGRFTWTEVTRVPKPTARRVTELFRARFVS